MAFLLALGLTLYPVISNYVNQKYASQIHTAYQEVMEQADDSELLKAKELANEYNRALVPGATDAYSQDSLLVASVDYDSQLNLAGNGIMGYVEIPKISVNLPIYHGTENDSLERSAKTCPKSNLIRIASKRSRLALKKASWSCLKVTATGTTSPP